MAKSLAPTTLIAPRYQQRFSCIGGACEDTCCSGWSISVDADHFRKLRAAYGRTKKDRELFEASVKRVRKGASKDRFALIVLDNQSKRCHLLDDDGLCGVHRRFGPDMLPNVCATYPRRQSVVRGQAENRLEVAAVLSCPEAARQALLPADAMEIVDVDKTAFVGAHWLQLVDEGSENVYEAAFDVVRTALLAMIAGAPSVTAGLATVAAFADALGRGFAREASAPIDPQTLVALATDFARPEVAAQLGAELRAIDVPLAVPMRALLQIISSRFSDPYGQFGVLRYAVSAYGISQNTVVTDVVDAFVARRAAVADLVERRLSEMLSNYALHHVFAHWYTRAPDLGVYVRGIILRVALVRFLVYAHPDVHALATAATPGDATRTVERVGVEVVYKLTRDVEHNGAFLRLLDQALPATMPGLEHALTLLEI